MLSPDLIRNFCRTSYWLALPDAYAALRLGEAPPAAFTAWLAAAGISSWAIVTAYNPGGCLTAPSTNDAAQIQLGEQLAASGAAWRRGWNIADGGDWPPEETYCIGGITSRQALSLARQFGQGAVVAGQAGGRATLLFCDQAFAEPALRQLSRDDDPQVRAAAADALAAMS